MGSRINISYWRMEFETLMYPGTLQLCHTATLAGCFSTQSCIFWYLLPNFKTQLLHNMAFNSYPTIKIITCEACNTIDDSWYTKSTKAASEYDVPTCQLKTR